MLLVGTINSEREHDWSILDNMDIIDRELAFFPKLFWSIRTQKSQLIYTICLGKKSLTHNDKIYTVQANFLASLMI